MGGSKRATGHERQRQSVMRTVPSTDATATVPASASAAASSSGLSARECPHQGATTATTAPCGFADAKLSYSRDEERLDTVADAAAAGREAALKRRRRHGRRTPRGATHARRAMGPTAEAGAITQRLIIDGPPKNKTFPDLFIAQVSRATMALMRRSAAAALLLLLSGGAAGLVAAPPRQAGASRTAATRLRTPPARALLTDSAAAVAAATLAAAAPHPLALATSTLLAADMFGKTFLAGISIAAATLVRPPLPARARQPRLCNVLALRLHTDSSGIAVQVTTIFVGIVVRGRYDELEQSFFDAQEAALQQMEVEEVRA
jgi:hypothetical protein